MERKNRQWLLARRPAGMIASEDSCCASQTRPEARASTGRASAPPASLAAIFPDAHGS